MKGILNDKEWYGYWQTQNLRQYLTKSAAPVGNMLPVAIAWPLLSEFIQTTEQAINGQSDNRVDLRFAHAETVIPFVALIHGEEYEYIIIRMFYAGRNLSG